MTWCLADVGCGQKGNGGEGAQGWGVRVCICWDWALARYQSKHAELLRVWALGEALARPGEAMLLGSLSLLCPGVVLDLGSHQLHLLRRLDLVAQQSLRGE